MSQEVLKSELDIFKSSSFQAGIESSQLVPFRPVNAIGDSSSLEFDIPAFPEHYLDLQNVFLGIKGKVLQSDGKAFDATQTKRYSLINYGLNTIFEQVDVKLANTLVSQSSNTYPYRSFLDLLTSYNSLAQNTHLRSAGYIRHGASAIDDPNEDLNAIIDESKEFSFYGRLHGDIFNSDKLLLNGVPLNINLIKGKNSFNFLASPAGGGLTQPNPDLKILDAYLFVRKVKLTPSLLGAHAKALQISNAKYPIKRTEVKVINLTSGQSSFVLDNVWMGQMPNKLIIGIVRHDAYTGSLSLNPLAFKNFGLNFLSVHINADIYPSKPYQPNYDGNQYEREYFELFNNLGATLSQSMPYIEYKNFKDHLCLYAFNFNSDFENPKENEYVNLSKDGFLNIELHFKQNLANALKVVCYAQFDNTIEIDSNRNVTTDF